MKPWSKYKIGKPPTGGSWAAKCRPFHNVGHVSHVEAALSIIRDGKVKASVIRDKSLLTDSPTKVSWVSPNDWNAGSHYGSVRFLFDFKRLVKGKRAYWIEAVEAYNPIACRILLTKDRRNDFPEFDPSKPDGPWWYDEKSDQHYFNDQYCIEFMAEQDIDLDESCDFDLVDHHPKYCALNRKSPRLCEELGEPKGKMGAHFLTCAASRRIDLSAVAHHFIDSTDQKRLSNAVVHSLNNVLLKLVRTVKDGDFIGKVRSGETALALARAILHATSIGQHDEALRIASLFSREEAMLKAVAKVVATTLQWDDWEDVYRKFV